MIPTDSARSVRFLPRLTRRILEASRTQQSGNWDFRRFGSQVADGLSGRNLARAAGRKLAHALPIGSRRKSSADVGVLPLADPVAAAAGAAALEEILERLDDFEWLHAEFADDASRHLLVEVLLFRILGAAHVKLPQNNAAFWDEHMNVEKRYLRESGLARLGIFELGSYSVPIAHGRLDFVGHPLSVLTLRLGQYYFEREGTRIAPDSGDVIIDGGGCWGETALVFAASADTRPPATPGRVYSFEFVPGNLHWFRDNLRRNPSLAPRVKIVENALGERSGEALGFTDAGPGTIAGGSVSQETARTVSIDDFAAQERLEKLDFIKLDIEGAEVATLKGASGAIRKFTPKIAACVYHSIDDFVRIPRLIRSLDSRYRLYLDHHTIHAEETVLYAAVPDRSGP